MSAIENDSKFSFNVEMGAARRPVLKVKINDSEFPLEITAMQAAQLGRALLAASFAATIKQAPPAGTPILGCELPVLNWGVSAAKPNGAPL